jgi:HemY protein
MIKLLWGIVLLAFATWVGLWAEGQHGTVWVHVSQWTLEFPLWMAVVGVVGVVWGFWMLMNSLHTLLNAPKRLRAWWQLWQEQRSRQFLLKGWYALSEMAPEMAEKYCLKSVSYAQEPVLSYMTAAEAAQQIQAYERRDRHLKEALALTPSKNGLSVQLMQARLQVAAGQYEEALSLLRTLQEKTHKHPMMLNLLKQVYWQLGNWEALHALLPDLKRMHVLKDAEWGHVERVVERERLWQTRGSLADCHALWRGLSRSLQQTPDLVLAYVDILLSHHESAMAEPLLRGVIKKNWDERLVLLYGRVVGDDLMAQLSTAESWLVGYPQSAALLLTCGRLSLRNQLWGKAERYFEASLALEPQAETYAELGRLYEQMEKPERSVEAFRKGLILLENTGIR